MTATSFRSPGLLMLVLLLNAIVAHTQISFTGTAYTQNFNTLATSGSTNSWANNSTLPGWFLFRQPAQYDPGTPSSATVTVTNNSCSMNLVTSKTNSTCPGCSNGTASVTVSGGTAPYTYLWTSNVSAGSAALYPVKDNSIYQQFQNNSNGVGEDIVAGVTAGNFINRGLINFDIAGNIPAGAIISNVSLRLNLTKTSGTTGAVNHSLHRALQNWGEGTSDADLQPGRGAPATANDATWLKTFYPDSGWTTPGGTFNITVSATTVVNNLGIYNWSSPGMAGDVQAWLDTPSDNFGWLIKSDEASAIKSAKQYSSKDHPDTANQPLLTIAYGPVVFGNANTVSNLGPGTYRIIVADAAGCSNTAFVTITEPTLLPNIISEDFICTNDRPWFIDGKVYVHNNATLFIEAGAVLKAVKKSIPEETSALVITRSGRIDCQGTNISPVLFTSAEASPQSGDWGGLFILGSAPLNRADTMITGIDMPVPPDGIDVFYGGGGAGLGNADQNSGVVRYTRIEYAGAALSGEVLTDRESAGFTVGGVGRGTELDFIQVSHSGDDAFNWLGGTVNARHLVAFAPHDDAFDFTFGYNGHIQFAVSKESATKLIYSDHPNGIESDNDFAGSLNAPRTNATISNFTVIGMEDSLSSSEYLPAPGSKRLLHGTHLRRSSGYTLRNSVLMGFPTGVGFESAATIGDVLRFQYNLVHGFRTADLGASIDGTNTEITGNAFNANLGVQLNDPFNATLPDFRPGATSAALTGANFTGLTAVPVNFFQVLTYRGAFSNSQLWTAAWTRFF